MKILCVLFTTFIIVCTSSASAASSVSSLTNITNTTEQAINNASNTINHTAKDVQKTIGPIQSMQIFDLLPRSEASYGIINSINSIMKNINSITHQIQQIFSTFGGGQ